MRHAKKEVKVGENQNCVMFESLLEEFARTIGNRSNKSGSHSRSSSGTSGEKGAASMMLSPCSTSTAARRPCSSTSLRKLFIRGRAVWGISRSCWLAWSISGSCHEVEVEVLIHGDVSSLRIGRIQS